MIVTERQVRKVAVEIKDNVSIDINKEISLALLGINESVNLKTIMNFSFFTW
jgi:hypothetical protein